MRPGHSETKGQDRDQRVRDRDRDQKFVMRPRPQTTRPRPRPRPVESIACESNTNRYVLFVYYTREVNDEPEMDFAFKMISK